MKQIVCSCGRIAEVRHRKNGKKLAFIHCTNGCGGIVSAKKAAEIEAQAKENIGTKGDFFKSISNDSSKTVQPKQASDFKPDESDLPENLESDIEIKPDEIESTPSKTGNGFKLFVGLLATACLGGGLYSLGRIKG